MQGCRVQVVGFLAQHLGCTQRGGHKSGQHTPELSGHAVYKSCCLCTESEQRPARPYTDAVRRLYRAVLCYHVSCCLRCQRRSTGPADAAWLAQTCCLPASCVPCCFCRLALQRCWWLGRAYACLHVPRVLIYSASHSLQVEHALKQVHALKQHVTSAGALLSSSKQCCLQLQCPLKVV